ncbi:tetratricopeptide repeat protein [Ruminococcaceae bacterium OttesenSCG-928-L11]|nr:tetratricopeptide repeat protein [Ruminococcaceae bacterium OttesenSCG-928-L11]
MPHQVIEINCPGCGARVSTGQKECEWCHKPIIISTFNSVYSMPMPEVNKFAGAYRKALAENPENQELNNSAAMCYLKLQLYDKALPAFEKAMEDNFDNSETFFYAAICLLQGKKAFLHQRTTIDKILEYINAALMIEPKGIYYYFLAYIKQDYFARKFFKTSPTYQEVRATAVDAGLSDFDIEQLYGILGVPRPECL